MLSTNVFSIVGCVLYMAHCDLRPYPLTHSKMCLLTRVNDIGFTAGSSFGHVMTHACACACANSPTCVYMQRKYKSKEKWDHVIGFTGGSSFGHVRLTAPVVDGGKEVVCG